MVSDRLSRDTNQRQLRPARARRELQRRAGRPGALPKLTHHQRQEAAARREAGEALVDTARTYNVSHSTISRLQQWH